jgi:alpha-tubulin suppressor-like RCC1 family protein
MSPASVLQKRVPRVASLQSRRDRAGLAPFVGAALSVAIGGFLMAPASGFAAGTAVLSWGTDGHGELGVGYHDGDETRPVSVVGLSEIKAVLAAGQTSYALLVNGTVRSWGADLKEELGNGVSSPRETSEKPVPVLEQTSSGGRRELTGVTAVAAAYGDDTHALALVDDGEHEGEVFTWGAGEYGERGNEESGFEKEGSLTPRDVAIAVPHLKHIVAIAAGGDSDYALEEEHEGKTVLWAWGENTGGKLGLGETSGPEKCTGEAGEHPCSTIPRQIRLPEGAKVKAIGVDKQAAFAILSNGTVLAWGENSHGELGTGTTENSDVPVYVCAVGAKAPCESGSRLEHIIEVSGGDLDALALDESGEVFGWGANGDSELGGSSSEECKASVKTCQKIPKRVAGLEHITSISAGRAFGVALNAEGEVYAWGDNSSGTLADGSTEGPETCLEEEPCSRTPLRVEGVSSVGGISAGGAEKGEGQVLVWLESGTGPVSLFSVTPESFALKVTWTVSAEEYRVAWRVEQSEVDFGKYTKIKGMTCSASSPCTYEITGLMTEPYEVQLNTYQIVEGKSQLQKTRVSDHNQPEA